MDVASILGESLVGVALDQALARMSIIRDWTGNRAQRHMVDQYLEAELARMHPLAYQYIDRFATDPGALLHKELPGGRLDIPVTLTAEGPVQLGKLEPSKFEEWTSSGYLGIREAIGGRLWNGDCYSAVDIRADTSGRPVIDGGLTTYNSALAHQDSVEWELLVQASRRMSGKSTRSASLSDLHEALPLRRALVNSYSSPMKAGTGPFSALAISTLIVYKDRKAYKLMVGKRSAETGAHADLFHVIPASMFQPELGSFAEEWDIRHTVLKEYAEELFNENLAQDAMNFRYFYRDSQPVAALLKAIRSRRCTFVITGLVVNQLNLRPEICALLLVEDPKWWETQSAHMRHNWEYVDRQELAHLASSRRRHWTDLRLVDIEQQYQQYFGLSPAMWVPSGLAALWLGVSAARSLLGQADPHPVPSVMSGGGDDAI